MMKTLILILILRVIAGEKTALKDYFVRYTRDMHDMDQLIDQADNLIDQADYSMSRVTHFLPKVRRAKHIQLDYDEEDATTVLPTIRLPESEITREDDDEPESDEPNELAESIEALVEKTVVELPETVKGPPSTPKPERKPLRSELAAKVSKAIINLTQSLKLPKPSKPEKSEKSEKSFPPQGLRLNNDDNDDDVVEDIPRHDISFDDISTTSPEDPPLRAGTSVKAAGGSIQSRLESMYLQMKDLYSKAASEKVPKQHKGSIAKLQTDLGNYVERVSPVKRSNVHLKRSLSVPGEMDQHRHNISNQTTTYPQDVVRNGTSETPLQYDVQEIRESTNYTGFGHDALTVWPLVGIMFTMYCFLGLLARICFVKLWSRTSQVDIYEVSYQDDACIDTARENWGYHSFL